MKNRISSQVLPIRSRAIALTLLLGAASAQALTQAAQPPAKAGAGQTTLTPAAPVRHSGPTTPLDDIRDIRQPKHLPTPWPWVAGAAGVVFLAVGFAAWRWLRRSKAFVMLPHEIALQELDEARQLMEPEHAREYCFDVSEIIRRYIEKQFQVHAPRLTTEEFLRQLVEVRQTMLASHRTLLGDVLQHCDLAKFAGWRYALPELEEMHASAREFVEQSALNAVPAPTSAVTTAATPTVRESAAPEVTPEPVLAKTA